MNLKFQHHRFALKETYTISKLFWTIDDRQWNYLCDILEDKVRDKNKDGDLDEEGEAKIYGETAIPYGKYKLKLSYSPKFKQILPEILNVKGFEGIRIHKGNVPENTLGCPLVGFNKIKGEVINSTLAFNMLMRLFDRFKQEEYEYEIV